MTDGDDPGAPRHPPADRWVISREPPFWVSTFYAPGLPPEGVSYRRRSYREAVKAGWEHYPEEFDADPEDDFGADLAAKSVAYYKAYLRKLSAVNNYTCAGAEVTSALASEQQASLRDMAAILHHSYWRVSRMRADLTFSPSRFPASIGWIMERIRPVRVAALVWRSTHSAWVLGRQARIIAADSVREARRAAAARSSR
jgi:hypothetical protein